MELVKEVEVFGLVVVPRDRGHGLEGAMAAPAQQHRRQSEEGCQRSACFLLCGGGCRLRAWVGHCCLSHLSAQPLFLVLDELIVPAVQACRETA